jgi:hypothetical protein
MRSLIVAILVSIPAAAFAQNIPASLQCKSTETQAECHARLHCRADEEVQACQKRLASTANDDRTGREQRESDDRSGREERSDDRGREDDRGDRGNRGGRDDRDNDRYREDDRGRRNDRGRSSRRHQGGGGGFEANKTFGLGLELGEPTGLTGKLFVSSNAALDFGIGYAYQNYYYDDGLHIYADFLFHPTVLAHADAFELPFYIGGGIRYWDFDFCDPQGICTYRGSAVGIRVPIGIDFDFNRAPIDIFLQIVPVIDFLHGDYYDRYRDRTHLAVDPSVGFRFWFK